MTITQVTEDLLSPELAKKADAIAKRISSVEKEVEQICMDVATDCENLEGETAFAYLKRAFPSESNKGSRQKYFYAGVILNESMRRHIPFQPGWTVAAEAYSLPPEGHEWFFAEKRTRKDIREYKASLNQIKEETNEVNEEQIAAIESGKKADAEYIAQLEAVIREQAAEIEALENELSSLTQHGINQPVRLGSAPTEEIQILKRPEHDENPLAPIDYNWHPGVQMGTKECDDFNRCGRLIDEVASIIHEYFLEGKFGPREWESLAGALGGPYDTCLAQRRFRPRPEQGPVINIR